MGGGGYGMGGGDGGGLVMIPKVNLVGSGNRAMTSINTTQNGQNNNGGAAQNVTVSGGLTAVTGGFQQSSIQQMAKKFFVDCLGVNLTWPKAVWFNDRRGSLLVKATAQDLDIIEAGVQILDLTGPR